jgi:hypothetical protein
MMAPVHQGESLHQTGIERECNGTGAGFVRRRQQPPYRSGTVGKLSATIAIRATDRNT